MTFIGEARESPANEHVRAMSEPRTDIVSSRGAPPVSEQAPDPPHERVIVRDGTAAYERGWAEVESRQREERWEKRKRSIDAERRERRAEMTALELHRHAIERQAKLSTVAAGSVEPSRGKSERAGPPLQQLLDDDPRWRENWAVIRSRLHRVHELLDEAEGLGASAEKTMLSSEKDRAILVQGRGYSCDAVVDLLGRDVAGSSRTVWRKRRNTQNPESEEFRILGLAVSTIDGQPLPPPGDPRVRRVRMDGR